MEIQIPSPSVFLRKSPVLPSAPVVQPKKAAIAKPKVNAPPKPANKPVQDGAVTKPKQSKSRNGEYACPYALDRAMLDRTDERSSKCRTVD
jgi:hypothetical protein